MLDLKKGPWEWLRQELDRWQALDLEAEFWWRDDDAVDVTPELKQLCQLSAQYSAPLSLAVIPKLLQPGLASYLNQYRSVNVLQHGFAHISHATQGERKLELGGNWETEQALSSLTQGRTLLSATFPKQFVSVMVPPWNRIGKDIAEALAQSDYLGISTMKARKSALINQRLKVVNTHLDPIHWRHRGGFLGTYPCIAILIQHLIAKRSGYRDPEEPTGLLTHHLVQNKSVWRFTEKLLDFLNQHPAAKWSDAKSQWENNSVVGRRV
ncbi:MAG: polysaccharide deacetylase family protein [Pseudomonadota bacterium]